MLGSPLPGGPGEGATVGAPVASPDGLELTAGPGEPEETGESQAAATTIATTSNDADRQFITMSRPRYRRVADGKRRTGDHRAIEFRGQLNGNQEMASFGGVTNRAGILPPMSSGAWRSGAAAARILIVDDDPNVLTLLSEQFATDGFDVATARDGQEALRRLKVGWPDLLIVDMMMPGMDGLTLAREIKAVADLPIVVLSAIDAADSKADLLEEFAEDYVSKPFYYPELRARVTRVLRRVGDKVPRQGLEIGPNLTLELHRRVAIVAGEEVQLTPTESRLLYALAANLGRTVSTESLLDRGWASTEFSDPSYVWVTMRRLRQKIELDANKPVHLVTVRGVGYRLVAAEAAPAS